MVSMQGNVHSHILSGMYTSLEENWHYILNLKMHITF